MSKTPKRDLPLLREPVSTTIPAALILQSVVPLSVPGSGVPAAAADTPTARQSYLAAVGAPASYNWTGLYVGLNAGWVGSAGNRISLTGTDTGGGGFGSELADGTVPSGIGLHFRGFIGGGQVGINGQMAGSPVVYGIEADIQGAAGAKDNFSITSTNPARETITTSGSRELEWLGTLRGRVGVTPIERVLLYVTGGLAYGEADLRIRSVCPTCGPARDVASTFSRTSAGWTGGGGIEFAITNKITIKGEYLYFDLGGNDTTIRYNYRFNASTMTAHSQNRGHIARAGINYKF